MTLPGSLWEKAFHGMDELIGPHEQHQWHERGRPAYDSSFVCSLLVDLRQRMEIYDGKRWSYIGKDGEKIFLRETEWMTALYEGVDYLDKLLACCDAYEKLYWGTMRAGSERLGGPFLNLYKSILHYLLKTTISLKNSNKVNVEEIGGMLLDIRSNKAELDRWVDIAEKEVSALKRTSDDSDMQLLRSLLGQIESPVHEQLKLVENIYIMMQEHRQFALLTWLSTVKFESHHLHFSNNRLPGTGSWLLENEAFTRWRQSGSNLILWLRSDAGFGKTMLASFIIDTFGDLQRSEEHVVAYFYCSYKDPEGSSPESILRTLVKQFCVKRAEKSKVPKLVDDVYREREMRGHSQGCLRIEESTELIIQLSQLYTSTTIVVDALDECDFRTRRTLFSALHKIARTAATSVKVVVTSRYADDIEMFFSQGPYHYISAHDNYADINLYIDIELDSRCGRNNAHPQPLLGGDVKPEFKAEIMSSLQSKANGMFLWVALQIDALCLEQTVGGIRGALARMPEALDETYSQAIERITLRGSNSSRLATIILKWLLFVQDACTTAIVTEALAVESGKETPREDMTIWEISRILGLCQNLVIHDETSGVFRLAHASVHDFLLKQPGFEKRSSNTYIAEICLTTLLYQHQGSQKLPALYTYAAMNWAAHVRLSEGITERLESLCVEFLTASVPYTVWSSNIVLQKSFLQESFKNRSVVCPLWVACYYELYHISKLLLGTSKDQNCCNLYGQTPLSWAARHGKERMVQLLLDDERVDVNTRDTRYSQTPLSWAAGEGHEKVVDLLLRRHGVDLNSRSKSGRTPLSWAAENGHEKVVQLLLEKGEMDLESRCNTGQTPLSLAAENGYDKVVQLLLEKAKAELNSRSDSGRTPLSLAASNGHWKVVQLLLRKEEVEADLKDKSGRTPLSWAAGKGHEKVVQLLLERVEVDANSKSNSGRMPSFWAAEKGYERIVQLLLEKGGLDRHSEINTGKTQPSCLKEEDYARMRGGSPQPKLESSISISSLLAQAFITDKDK